MRVISDFFLSKTMQAISDTISQQVTRDKEGHFKIEDAIHQEDILKN